MRKITRVVVTTDDGVEHVYDHPGRAVTRTTTMKGPGLGDPVSHLEVVVPLDAEWATGEEGRYIKVVGGDVM